MSAVEALCIERNQIETELGLASIVSLTDHDDINAARDLAAAGTPEPLISVEWTVPFRGTFLHVGVHNLAPEHADEMFRGMSEYTERPEEEDLIWLLEWLAADDRVLIVLNHPLWDEKGIGRPVHRNVVYQFLLKYQGLVHALKLNGLRAWHENVEVAHLAEAVGLPVISGGDRHGKEPNALVNLTNATCFAGFVSEVRLDQSQVLCMPQYRQSRTVRIFQSLADALGEHSDHALGQTKWSDRVLYRCATGEVHSLADLWGKRAPAPLGAVAAMSGLVKRNALRMVLRAAFVSEELA